LALLALIGAARGTVACSSDSVGGGAPGDGGAPDGTVATPDAALGSDAAEAGMDAVDAGDAAADVMSSASDGAVDGSGDASRASDAADDGAETTCTPVDAGPLDDAEVALGAQIVGAHRCTSCHGEQLAGSPNGVASPTAIGGTAYPPNLTPDPATGLGCWTDEQIENAFLDGIDNEGMALCAPMPRFGHFADGGGIDPAQAPAVVQYLRSLPIVSQQVPDTPDCPVADAQAEAAVDGGDAGEGGD
jgi:hypothetical protein